MGQLTLTTPLSGRFFIGRMGLAMVSQCTKYEVSRFTRYEAMNGDAIAGYLSKVDDFDPPHLHLVPP